MYKDFLGQELHVDDYVAGISPNNETPQVFKITGFTPKKIKLGWLIDEQTILKFPDELLKLDLDIVTQNINSTPRDALGQKLEVGDYVLGSDASYVDPVIFEILEFYPRRAKLTKVAGERSYVPNKIRHTTDLIKVDPKLIMMYKLTKKEDDNG